MRCSGPSIPQELLKQKMWVTGRRCKGGVTPSQGSWQPRRVAGKYVRKYTLRHYSFFFKEIQAKSGKYSVNPCPPSEIKAFSRKSWYKGGHGKYLATRHSPLCACTGQ